MACILEVSDVMFVSRLDSEVDDWELFKSSAVCLALLPSRDLSDLSTIRLFKEGITKDFFLILAILSTGVGD